MRFVISGLDCTKMKCRYKIPTFRSENLVLKEHEELEYCISRHTRRNPHFTALITHKKFISLEKFYNV